ncbi:hypothetical protein [Marinigracilibium pacificum]|uniref:Uncharacterized protein n=1 Tax=Marinigracilibium pacificum TaxID=2729599 RepID=A0A848IZI9_9BACT|nr:hypothetical protein [Marinigracilibium pacificum]NMM48568.1 hypothetical protein [Marinigracilibium pacificum]
MKNKLTMFVMGSLFLLAACDTNDNAALESIEVQPIYMDLADLGINARTASDAAEMGFALYKAEFLTIGEDGEVGNTVFFMDVGNKQLGADFVPNYPPYALDGTDAVSYYIDENRPSDDLDVSISTAAFDRAMTTWDNVICSDLGMYKVPSNPMNNTGFIAALLGFGGSFNYFADVVHCGFMDAAFFEILRPGGSNNILGVTFTIIFTNGGPTDVDGNGKIDVAFREIYYNDNFPWFDGANYDVETVALHEAGHGLSQAHFGKAFLDNGSGKLHFSPRAVMNAAYSGIQTDIMRTDNAGHCSNWSNWPNN